VALEGGSERCPKTVTPPQKGNVAHWGHPCSLKGGKKGENCLKITLTCGMIGFEQRLANDSSSTLTAPCEAVREEAFLLVSVPFNLMLVP
jgi:hypothetical protein